MQRQKPGTSNHRKPLIVLLLMAAICFSSASSQEVKQPEQPPTSALKKTVVNIWPGVAPGSEQWKQPETTLGSGDMERIVNVTTPTLTAYLPDPSNATGTAVIIAPGGGFVFLGINSEGHDVAKWLVARGIAAFVLKYRTVQIEGQNEAQLNQSGGARFRAQLRNHALIAEDGKYGIADGIQAVKVVRAHAAEWGISRDRIVFTGFSAGGMITEFTAIQPDARPNYAAPIYGAPFPDVPQIPQGLPPFFMAMAQDDNLAGTLTIEANSMSSKHRRSLQTLAPNGRAEHGRVPRQHPLPDVGYEQSANCGSSVKVPVTEEVGLVRLLNLAKRERIQNEINATAQIGKERSRNDQFHAFLLPAGVTSPLTAVISLSFGEETCIDKTRTD